MINSHTLYLLSYSGLSIAWNDGLVLIVFGEVGRYLQMSFGLFVKNDSLNSHIFSAIVALFSISCCVDKTSWNLCPILDITDWNYSN